MKPAGSPMRRRTVRRVHTTEREREQLRQAREEREQREARRFTEHRLVVRSRDELADACQRTLALGGKVLGARDVLGGAELHVALPPRPGVIRPPRRVQRHLAALQDPLCMHPSLLAGSDEAAARLARLRREDEVQFIRLLFGTHAPAGPLRATRRTSDHKGRRGAKTLWRW